MNYETGKRWDADPISLMPEIDHSEPHVCAKDRRVVIRSFPQGDGFIEVFVCSSCYFNWADADLSEVLR